MIMIDCDTHREIGESNEGALQESDDIRDVLAGLAPGVSGSPVVISCAN